MYVNYYFIYESGDREFFVNWLYYFLDQGFELNKN